MSFKKYFYWFACEKCKGLVRTENYRLRKCRQKNCGGKLRLGGKAMVTVGDVKIQIRGAE